MCGKQRLVESVPSRWSLKWTTKTGFSLVYAPFVVQDGSWLIPTVWTSLRQSTKNGAPTTLSVGSREAAVMGSKCCTALGHGGHERALNDVGVLHHAISWSKNHRVGSSGCRWRNCGTLSTTLFPKCPYRRSCQRSCSNSSSWFRLWCPWLTLRTAVITSTAQWRRLPHWVRFLQCPRIPSLPSGSVAVLHLTKQHGLWALRHSWCSEPRLSLRFLCHQRCIPPSYRDRYAAHNPSTVSSSADLREGDSVVPDLNICVSSRIANLSTNPRNTEWAIFSPKAPWYSDVWRHQGPHSCCKWTGDMTPERTNECKVLFIV